MMKTITGKLLEESKKILYANWEKYRGRHVLVVGRKVYTAKTGSQALKILEKLEKKDPTCSPLITYIPKAGTLILWF